ncbi:MAG TPA: hypothetical protein DIC52_07125 [Candidatus Latescibacteria bacterium]|jgi:hypothetical protein|nr:hypothetical protein [Candidatus Latescibacterota bacterium]
MGHQSRFDVITRGGVTAGQEWICDGDEPIAQLEHVVVEQPEQNLRYFDRNLKPVVLRNLKLVPGGRPLVAGVQMFWNLDGHIVTSDLLDIIVEGRGTERLTITVITGDPGGVALSRRVLTLRWDEGDASYVYDFTCHLELCAPETFDRPGSENIHFEISDPWYCDVPAPTVAFDGGWSAHGFTRLLAEPADGSVWQMPLNHLATSIPAPKSFRHEGMLVLADSPGNNPAFEFVGETATRTGIGVCNWGYDVHFSASYERQELYAPICETFRVRRCPDDRVAELLLQAQPVPTVEYAGHRELPRYERQSSFDKPLRLDEPAGALDPWPWVPAGEGARWCRDLGRSDDNSLQIQRQTTGVTEWRMDREGEGAWTQRWRTTTGFNVHVWVRTDSVSGRGASLALRWILYNQPERHPLLCAASLQGTTDWTRLTAQILGPAPADVSAVEIVLRLDGIGTVWFDDIDVEVLAS